MKWNRDFMNNARITYEFFFHNGQKYHFGDKPTMRREKNEQTNSQSGTL